MARVYVAPISFGLGDLVVSIPVVQALIADGRRTGDETWLVARSASQALLSQRIPGLAGCVDEETFRPVPGTDRVVDLRDHPLQRDYWWGSAEFEAALGPLDINLNHIGTSSYLNKQNAVEPTFRHLLLWAKFRF